MKGRAGRLVAIVAARRAAAQGRLAACLAEQSHLRDKAARLARSARTAPPGGDAADMLLTAGWQARLHDAVKAALTKADGLEDEAGSLRARLALALGREQAVDALAAAERTARRKRADRRAEDAAPAAGRAPPSHGSGRISGD